MKQFLQFTWNWLLIIVLIGIAGCSFFDEPAQHPAGPTGSPLESSDRLNIVGGVPALHSNWPWIAALVAQGEPPVWGQFCGGTLIHPMWVLTATHCLEGPGGIDVILGTSSLVSRPGQYERIPIIRQISHPAYNAWTSDHDIALLRLAYPSTMPPANWDHYSLAQPGVYGVVAGWGATDAFGESYPTELLQVTIPIIPNDICTQSFFDGELVTENMLCAGYPEGGRDSCFGDSGGPLMVNGVLAGIVSWGSEFCAQAGGYGVYTRVANYSWWIASVINSPMFSQ